jgi:hypothetical protein
MVVIDNLLQAVEFGHLQISVELLQSIVNPGTHERLNAFGFSLYFINVGEFILVRACFISG